MRQNNTRPNSNLIRNYLLVSRDKGFSSILALALGTLIIGGAFLAIARASQGRNQVAAQQQTDRALAAAEAGVARIQDLLLREPRLAKLDLPKWREVANATDSLQKLTELTGIDSSGRTSSCSVSSSTQLSSQDVKNQLTQIAGIVTGTSTDPTGWVQLDNNTSYRVIGYDGNGNLKVQGRLNNNNAISQIAVKFAVTENTSTSTSANATVPVVWLGSHTGNDVGNNKLYGKVRVTVPTASTNVTISVGPNGRISEGIDPTTECMPLPPSLPSSYNTLDLSQATGGSGDSSNSSSTATASGGNNNNNSSKNNASGGNNSGNGNANQGGGNGNGNSGGGNSGGGNSGGGNSGGGNSGGGSQKTVIQLPRGGDTPGADGYYHYLVPSLILNGNGDLKISANRKVVFYLQGNLNIGGNSDIIVENGAQLEIYGNVGGRYCRPSDTNCPQKTGEILIRGNAAAGKVFIHAPEAKAGINGGGNSNPNFQGAIWAKNWGFSDGNVGELRSYGTFNDYLGSKRAVGSTRIAIRPVSGWQREAVSQNN